MPHATIHYLGHSTVFIETESGKRVLIDPWLKGNPRCPEAYYNLDAVDLICLTHGHSDHASSAVEVAQRSNAVVVATYELAMLLVKDGVSSSNIQPMNKGGTIRIPNMGLEVSLTNALHSSSYDAADGNTYYAGEPCGVVLRLESGRTIYHAGDTCLFSDISLIGRRYRPEVALLPIGDRFTMGPQEAAEAVRMLGAPTVIPIHYATFPLLTGTAEDFVRYCSTVETTVVALEPGEAHRL